MRALASRPLTVAVLCALGPSAVMAVEKAPLVLVLDASGSMWGQAGGEAKIVGARRVVGELAAGLADDRELALVAYGHRREADCTDIETVVALAPLDRGRLQQSVDLLYPRGKTPITAAIEHALVVAPSGSTVLVVTDGLETCGGDPCAAVREAKQRGGEFVLHVVGLDVGKEDVSSLECAAQAGGGLYLPAANASELATALESVAALPAVVPAGALVLRATRNGALQDVALKIVPEAGMPEIGARTYTRPETNPRTVPLADGRYRVRVLAVGIDGDAERSFDLEIVDGSRVEREVDFSTGELVIGATRNGELSDVGYSIFTPGDRKRAVASGRTYRAARSNPARVTIAAGEYEVVLHALELGGGPKLDLGRVVVRPSESSEMAHDFASGELVVGAVRGGTLVDATVAVRAGGKSIDAGRTYTSASSNPKRFTLAPGDYLVEVSEVRGEKRSFSVLIQAGGEYTHVIDFARPER